MIMPALRTSLIISYIATTTLRSWLFHDGPLGLTSRKPDHGAV